MKKNIIILLVCSLPFLQGCVTPYQKESLTGGYDDLKLQDGIYKVAFRANARVGWNKAQNYALLRCAEVTLENGYNYFIISSAKSRVNGGVRIEPAYLPVVIHRIRCFEEKPENLSTVVYNAKELQMRLRSKYNLNKKKTNKKDNRKEKTQEKPTSNLSPK